MVFICITFRTQSKEDDFDKGNKTENWRLDFEEECTQDWTKKWTRPFKSGVE